MKKQNPEVQYWNSEYFPMPEAELRVGDFSIWLTGPDVCSIYHDDGSSMSRVDMATWDLLSFIIKHIQHVREYHERSR